MWRFVLATLGGVNLGELRQATSRHVDLVHRGLDAGSFVVPLNHPLADVLSTGDALVKAYLETSDGVKRLRVCGPIITVEENGDEQGNGTLAVTFGSVYWRMAFRLIGKSNTGYSDGTAVAQKDIGSMAAALITRVQQPEGTTFDAGGDAGIRIGGLSAVRNGWIGPWYYKPVNEAISEMANVLDGFDFDVLPTEPTPDATGLQLGTFVAAPFLGEARPNVIFEYGAGKKNVSSYRKQLTNEALLNAGYQLPSGFPESATESVLTAFDAASIAARGRYEGVVPGDLIVPEFRQQLVQEHVDIRKQARVVFTFTPTIANGYEIGVDFDVGDIIGARVKSTVPGNEEIRFDGSVRCYAASFDIDDAGRAEPALTLIASEDAS
jgi:hypothetical protein